MFLCRGRVSSVPCSPSSFLSRMLVVPLFFLLCCFLTSGANPLATDANGLVPCEKHITGGRQEMKQLLEAKAFQGVCVCVCKYGGFGGRLHVLVVFRFDRYSIRSSM